MACTYRNTNTDDVVTRAEPDARLEFLPNWERIEGGETEPEDLAAERERLVGRLSEIDALLAAAQEETKTEATTSPADLPPASASEQPAVRDSKDTWVAYADRVDPGVDHSGLTKQELVDKYGEAAPANG